MDFAGIVVDVFIAFGIVVCARLLGIDDVVGCTTFALAVARLPRLIIAHDYFVMQ